MYVYFIQAGDGPIKIGVANDPDDRLAAMQTGTHEELFLLAAVIGSYKVERELHARFAEGRIRGEWFAADTPGLREEINRAIRAEAAELDATDVCKQCGRKAIIPPRRHTCSDDCATARRRETTRKWKAAHRT